MSTYTRLPEGMGHKGTKAALRRDFSLSETALRNVPAKIVAQINMCADDSARRLLLGKGRKA